MLVFQEKQIFHLFLVVLKRTAFLAVLFLLLAPWQKVSAVGFEEVCRGSGAGVCDSGLECDSAEDICLGSNGYVCQNNNDCANGLSCLAGKCAVDLGAGQGERLGLGKSTSDLRDQIRTFINIFLGFLGVLGVLMMIYGGFLWMTSRGNAEQVKKAKQTLLYAVLGMLVILISWTITSYILYLGQKVGGTGEGSGGRGDITTLPPEPGTPGSLSLEIEEFGTQHQGQDMQNNVYPSCGINIDFNLYVDPASVDKAKNTTLASPLRVEKADMPGMAVRDFFTNANRVTYPPKKWTDNDGQSQSGDDLILGNRYQVVLPGIFDSNEHPSLKSIIYNNQQYLLQNCQGNLQDACTIIGNDIYWYFRTIETEEELPKVSLASTIPAGQARNVPTYPVITLKFSGELFAPSFLNDKRFKDNIKIRQTNNGDCDINDLSCVVAGLVSIAENWEVYLDGQNVSFYYRPTPRAELAPFSWYYFQADGILDLCGQEIIGNIDQSSEIILRFQVGEGAKLIVYPPNGANTLCPGDVPIYAQSTISLFDPLIGGCGYNVVGSLNPVAGRDLIVQDPGLDGCTQYEFLPLTALAENQKYQTQVLSDFDITETEKLKTDWQFSTMTEEKCDNPPAITQISPDVGSHGQCLGIIGQGFKGKSTFEGAHKDENLIHFEKKDLPNEFLNQTYEAILTSPQITGSWSDNNIITIFPKDKFVKNDQIIISMQRYSEVVGKMLSTAANPIFTINNDQVIDKPLCLTFIEPNHGFKNSNIEVTLSGKNFTTKNEGESLINQVKFTGPEGEDSLLAQSYYWYDDSAKARVPGTAESGLVFVHKIIDTGGQDIKSNGYLFTVQLPPPEEPQIIHYAGCSNGRLQTPSPYSDKADVCLIDYSGQKRVIFFLEYDRSIQLKPPMEFSVEDCGQGINLNCQGTLIPNGSYQFFDDQVITNPDPNHEGLKITMTGGSLSANTWYQANLQAGVADGNDVNIAADPFIWSFKTKEPLTICQIDKVDVSLSKNEIIYKAGEDNASLASAKATDTDTCQQLDAGQFSWNWSAEDITGESDKPIASLDSDHHTADNEVIATGEDFGQANIKAEWDKSQIIGSAVLKVTTGDPTLCDPHQLESCLQSGDCMGSQCILTTDGQHHCTPVVKNLSPAQGPAGTWLEIEGCHFGKEKGKVDFNGEAEGIFKFPEQCKSFWTNEKILTEVPTIVDIGLKSIKVITSLELGSNDDQKFDLTKDPLLPQLCGLNTTSGERKSTFTAYGKFHESPAAETSVFVGNEESTDIDKSQSEIKSKVGPNAQLGEQIVKVSQYEKQSPQEDIKFTVISGDGPITPEQKFIKILDYSPKADNVCQNAVVSVKFDSLIDYDNLKNNLTLIDENGNPAQCLYNQSTAALPYWQKVFAFLKKLIKNVYAGEEIGDCGVWEFTSTNNSTTAFLNPGDLDPVHYLQNKNYFINIKTKGDDSLVSKQGGTLRQEDCKSESVGGIWDQPNPDVAFCKLPFPGGKDICIADRITINNDENEIFLYDKNKTEPNGNGEKELNLFGYYGNILINLQSGIESGDYSSPIWQVIPENDIITLDKKDGVNNIAYAFSLNSPIGSNVVQVNITVSQTSKKLSDTIIATLSLCASDIDDPGQYFWKFYDPLKVNTDPPGNFSLSYCRYQTNNPASPLPLLDKEPTFPQENQISKNAEMDILKEYYFKFVPDPDQGETLGNFPQKPYAKDFFILRIMPNWEQDYFIDWFKKEKDKGNLKGIPMPEVNKENAYAYEKADGGNIFFVNALNLVKDEIDKECDDQDGISEPDTETDCKMFTNVYILSYNQEGAAKETEDIFTQLKNNWQFNTNFYNDSGFIIAGVTEEQIQRDWQRIRDLNSIASALDNYQLSHQGKYPYQNVLDRGVKLPGVAVSKWQQEWSILGTELAMSLPYDPINVIQCKGTNGEQSRECFYQKGEEGEKRGTYYCRSDPETGDQIDDNTYAYQYQLTGECYRYDEVELKCSQRESKDKCDKDPDHCIWQKADMTDPKSRTKDQCESICSSDGFSLAEYCDWDIPDGRCFSSAQSYVLYGNFEYSPNPWCKAKKAEYCKEYSFCRLENSECIAPSLTNDQQPLCSGFAEPVFNVIF